MVDGNLIHHTDNQFYLIFMGRILGIDILGALEEAIVSLHIPYINTTRKFNLLGIVNNAIHAIIVTTTRILTPAYFFWNVSLN